MAPAIRQSRVIRARKAKRKAPRMARSMEFSRRGVRIDGTMLPYWIGTDVEVTVWGTKAHAVQITILTETVKVIEPIPRHSQVTYVYP